MSLYFDLSALVQLTVQVGAQLLNALQAGLGVRFDQSYSRSVAKRYFCSISRRRLRA